jgi:riboflavin-specific deaminase-like protein
MRPFVFINVAATADGKIAPSHRRFIPFGGARDREHLLELRATADAVMAGARTVDSFPVTMGAGGPKYRKLRRARGLAEQNLRVIVSGAGTIDPKAEIFRRRLSPIIILTTGRAPESRLRRLQALADEVKVFGADQLDFAAALRWLRTQHGVRRLLCEGGGALNGALFQAGLVDELHLTLCPRLFGGRDAPTLADGAGVSHLVDATRLKLASMKQAAGDLFLVYTVKRPARAATPGDRAQGFRAIGQDARR